jgi:hypothetical protein
LIAEALDRTVGIKRGRRILGIALPGIVAGGLAGVAFSVFGWWQQMMSFAGSEEPGALLDAYLFSALPFALLAVLVAAGVAAARLR